jgi:hypothetical protein
MTPPPPPKGKSTNDDLLVIQETILPLFMVILQDQLNGVHSLAVILTEAAKYETDHGNTKFAHPAWLLLYDKTIADDATTVVCICEEAAHKSCLDDYVYKVAKHGVVTFLRDIVNEVW